MRTPSYLVGIIIALGLGACVGMGMMKHDDMASDDMMDGKSLYDRLGGQGDIEAVVDDFAARLEGDGRINRRFAGADLGNVKRILVE